MLQAVLVELIDWNESGTIPVEGEKAEIGACTTHDCCRSINRAIKMRECDGCIKFSHSRLNSEVCKLGCGVG
jgi:hypothetical protein